MSWSIAVWTLQAIAAGCLIAAALTDIADRLIPNRIVLVVMGVGLVLRSIDGPIFPLGSIAIWSVTLLALGWLASRDVIGWGDAKMIPATTLLVSPHGVLRLLVSIAIAGGVLACGYLAARSILRAHARSMPRRPIPLPARLAGLLEREGARILNGEPMPYAVAILGGAFSPFS